MLPTRSLLSDASLQTCSLWGSWPYLHSFGRLKRKMCVCYIWEIGTLDLYFHSECSVNAREGLGVSSPFFYFVFPFRFYFFFFVTLTFLPTFLDLFKIMLKRGKRLAILVKNNPEKKILKLIWEQKQSKSSSSKHLIGFPLESRGMR